MRPLKSPQRCRRPLCCLPSKSRLPASPPSSTETGAHEVPDWLAEALQTHLQRGRVTGSRDGRADGARLVSRNPGRRGVGRLSTHYRRSPGLAGSTADRGMGQPEEEALDWLGVWNYPRPLKLPRRRQRPPQPIPSPPTWRIGKCPTGLWPHPRHGQPRLGLCRDCIG